MHSFITWIYDGYRWWSKLIYSLLQNSLINSPSYYPKLRIRVRTVSQKRNKGKWARKILIRQNSSSILRMKIENAFIFEVVLAVIPKVNIKQSNKLVLFHIYFFIILFHNYCYATTFIHCLNKKQLRFFGPFYNYIWYKQNL